MSLSDLPGEVTYVEGPAVADSVLGLLAAKMSKNLVRNAAQYEPVHLVRVKMTGAQKADLVYLHSRFSSWENHPAAGSIISELTDKGQKWFEGMLTSPSIGVTSLGDRVVFGVASAADPFARNQSVSVPQDNGVAIAADLGLPLIADTCYQVVANGKETTTLVSRHAALSIVYTRNDANSAFWDATMEPMFVKVRKAALRLGYKEVHPTFAWYLNEGMEPTDTVTGTKANDIYSRGMMAGLKHGWKPFVISSSGSSLMILVPDDGSGRFFIGATKRLTDVGKTTSANFAFKEFLDPRYSQSHNVFDSNYGLGTALAYLRANYFVEAKSAVDAFGLSPAGYNQPSKITLDNANRSPFSRTTIEYFTGLKQAYLLPLIAPPGNGEYFASFDIPTLAITREVLQRVPTEGLDVGELFMGDPSSTEWTEATVKETVVNLHATQLLTGVTSDWYLEYIQKGYGYFEPKSEADIAKARELVTSYEGLVLTACAYDQSFMLPQDIVEQLQIYRMYKKSRDKACLSNDFMKKEMANGMTWGTANSLCNGSRSTTILYGYKETLASSIALNPSTGSALGVTYTLKGVAAGQDTVLARTGGDEPGDVGASEVDRVFGDLAMGATLVGITAAALLTAWGADSAAITAEQAALKADAAHLNQYGGSNGRGYGLAPYDFSWENIGVSGYPIYHEAARDDAFKMAIISKAQIQKKTELLRQAYLGFATSTIVSNFLRK